MPFNVFKWNSWIYSSERPLTSKCWVNCRTQDRSKEWWDRRSDLDEKLWKHELRWWQWGQKKKIHFKDIRRINKVPWQILHWGKRWERIKNDTWVSGLVDLLESENIYLERNKERETDLGEGVWILAFLITRLPPVTVIIKE